MSRKLLAPAAVALLLLGSVALVALAQDGPPTKQSSFCVSCHANLHIAFNKDQPVVAKPPAAPHQINPDWTSSDCASCHRLEHNGKNATHGVDAEQQGGQFCATCHMTGEVPFSGDEPASFCIECHQKQQSQSTSQ
ncbi:MAG: hypothetical protein ABEK03_05430 [Candidatus Bipolaricaulia bacterium]